jgi:hypothetical protein
MTQGQRNDTSAVLSSACVDPVSERSGRVEDSRRYRLNERPLKFGARKFRNARRELTRIGRGVTIRRVRGSFASSGRRWLWLFPATYAVHVLEEGLTGERFYRWIGHASGRVLDPPSFWLVNGVLWALMVIVIVCARKRVELGWIMATVLGTVAVVNGVGHAVGTAMVRSYSPGLVSGVLLWVPLGSWTLWHSRRAISGPSSTTFHIRARRRPSSTAPSVLATPSAPPGHRDDDRPFELPVGKPFRTARLYAIGH